MQVIHDLPLLGEDHLEINSESWHGRVLNPFVGAIEINDLPGADLRVHLGVFLSVGDSLCPSPSPCLCLAGQPH
jgi:hypothetical protein